MLCSLCTLALPAARPWVAGIGDRTGALAAPCCQALGSRHWCRLRAGALAAPAPVAWSVLLWSDRSARARQAPLEPGALGARGGRRAGRAAARGARARAVRQVGRRAAAGAAAARRWRGRAGRAQQPAAVRGWPVRVAAQLLHAGRGRDGLRRRAAWPGRAPARRRQGEGAQLAARRRALCGHLRACCPLPPLPASCSQVVGAWVNWRLRLPSPVFPHHALLHRLCAKHTIWRHQ